MNDKVKAFFVCIASFFIGIFYAVFSNVLHNRRATDGTRETIGNAKERNSEIESGTDNAKDIGNGLAKSTERVEQSVERIAESVERSGNIFDTIRKQKLEK